MSVEIQAALDLADETDSFLQITDVIYDKEAEVGYDALRSVEQSIFCIDGLLREMENGGFIQFFRQQAGGYSADTALALERIKAKESLRIFNQMLSFFPDNQVPSDEEARLAAFEIIEHEHTEEVARLDDEYHETGENIIELTLLFVQRNLKEFR